MRTSGVIGILLIALAVLVLIGGGFATRHDVLQMGDMKVSMNDRQPFPPWVSGLAIIAGVVLVVTGTRRRTG
jgi:hypothetical protein